MKSVKYLVLIFITILVCSGTVLALDPNALPLVAYWPMNEGSGDTFYADSHSNNGLDLIFEPLSGDASTGTQGVVAWLLDTSLEPYFDFLYNKYFRAEYEPYGGFPIDLDKSFKVTFEFIPGGNVPFVLSNPDRPVDVTPVWVYKAFEIGRANGYIMVQQHSSGTWIFNNPNMFLGVDSSFHTVEVIYDADTTEATVTIDGTYSQTVSGINLDNNADNHDLVVGYRGVHSLEAMRHLKIYQYLNRAADPVPYDTETGVVVNGGTIPLNWKPPYEGFAGTYNVYFDTVKANVDNNVTLLTNTALTSTTASVVEGEVYYWKVESIGGTADSGVTWEFQTLGITPHSLVPADNSEDVSPHVTLEWTVDEPGDVDSIELYIGMNEASLDSETPIVLANTANSYSLALDALELQTEYFWKVVSVAGGMEYDSPVRSFTTSAYAFAEGFAYGDSANLQAAWVPTPMTPEDLKIQYLSRPDAPYSNPAFANIAYGPTGTGNSESVYTFDTPIDLTTVPAVTARVFHESEVSNANGMTLSFLNSGDTVLYSVSYDPYEGGATPEVKVWVQWGAPLADSMGQYAAGMDAVAKIKLTVNDAGYGVPRWLFVDDVMLGIPACPADSDLTADINGDCQVDIKDISVMFEGWLDCQRIPADSCFDYFFEAF